MRKSRVKFFTTIALVLCMVIGMVPSVTVHAAGSVALYVNGSLKGNYGDIMSAFNQMTDKNADYVVRLTDAAKNYEVTEGYMWPAVKSIKITGPSTDAFGCINIKGNNTLRSDLELEMIAIGSVNEDTAPEFYNN